LLRELDVPPSNFGGELVVVSDSLGKLGERCHSARMIRAFEARSQLQSQQYDLFCIGVAHRNDSLLQNDGPALTATEAGPVATFLIRRQKIQPSI
jgi:hypothetical protein